MQNNRRKKRANEFVISIAMHLALFGLLIWSSLYQTVEIMGGGEGEGDAMGAVMVDTGSAAQEWGRIQQQKKGQTDKQKKPEPVVEEKKPEPEPEPNQQEIAKQEEIKRQQEIQRQKELEKQKQQEIEKQKQQQELARQEALEKQKQAEEAKAKQAAEAAKLKADAEAKRLAAAAKQAEEEAKAKAQAEAQKAKEKAEKIQKEVEKNPNKFGEIAKKESMDSSSAKKDGSLGYVIKGQMVDSFEKALFKLKEGEVSKVVKTDYGYHIIKADKETDFNSEKSNIKQKLIEEKVQKKPKLLTDAYKELLKEYKVDYKDRDIKKAIEDSILDPDKIKQQQQQQSQGGSGLTNSGS